MSTDAESAGSRNADISSTNPFISIVVPIFNVEQYLDDCLSSILDQTFANLEVIAADGASTDGSRAILRAWARKDSRLRLLALDRPGAGRARNAGLGASRGDYVWFVDADDMITDGALLAIAAKITEFDPDILLIGHDELHPGGHIRSSAEAHLLRSAPPSFTIADNPSVVNLTMTSWSKVVRRKFLVSLCVPFPEGRHEDVPVCSAALLGARKISTLDHVCYRYRKNRPGALMALATKENVAIFDSYHYVFEMLGKRIADSDPKVTERVVAAFFERAVQHYASVLSAGSRGSGRRSAPLIPSSYRREFFRLMHNDYVTYRPAGYRKPHGARAVEYLLIEHNAFTFYAALEPLNHWRVALAKKVSGRLS